MTSARFPFSSSIAPRGAVYLRPLPVRARRRYGGFIARSTRKKSPKKPKGRPSAGAETPPFERVWRLVKSIPPGKVATYGQLSRWIDGRLTPVGVGWAVRAAGEAQIPWQRVVNGQGGISTDDQHPGLQRAMLEAEGVKFAPDGRIDLARYGWHGPRSARAGR